MLCIGYTKKGIVCRKKHLHGSEYCKIHSDLYKLQKPDECPICMESITEEFRPLDCGHWVHKKCLLKWKDICPSCKAIVKLTTKERKILQVNSKTEKSPIEINITFNDDNTTQIDFDDWFNSLLNIFEN